MKPSRSSDHNAVKLEINERKIFEKIHKYLEIKQHNDIKTGQRKNHKRNQKIFKMNKNEKSKISDLWSTAKTMNRDNFMQSNAYIR